MNGRAAMALIAVGAALLTLAAVTEVAPRGLPRGRTRRVRPRSGRWLPRLTSLATRIARSALGPERVDRLTAELVAAGRTAADAVELHLASKALVAATAAAMGLMTGTGARHVAAVAMAVIGWVLPDLVLRRAVRRRQAAIGAAVPEMAELLAHALDAGAPLGRSLALAARFTGGPLKEEIAVALTQVRLGSSPADAWERLCARNGSPDLARLVGVWRDAATLGTPLSRRLVLLAEGQRRDLRTAARAQAAKAAQRATVVAAVFLLPAVLVLVLGGLWLSIEADLPGGM